MHIRKFEAFMRIAIEEAKLSLREGNHGFGAIVVRNGEIISKAHDREKIQNDPTSHAELEALRIASAKLGGNLNSCIVISTHEPCPMCAAAIVWAGISAVVYGCNISDTLKEGRRRINIPCREIFQRGNADITITEGVLKDECAVLYNEKVRKNIKLLRNVTNRDLIIFSDELGKKRKEWFQTEGNGYLKKDCDVLEKAYSILINKLGINECDAPVIEKKDNRIVFHSKNFCPTLEACKILNLDTRYICKKINEDATDILVKQVNPMLKFTRNYNKLRPYADYCEEIIILEKV